MDPLSVDRAINTVLGAAALAFICAAEVLGWQLSERSWGLLGGLIGLVLPQLRVSALRKK